ncbi:MAG TPA: homocysteine S-methyltransferase [Thermoanaerobaculia bacterium]|nr:homocysteine S-methyltransferase [Thermoanaerobaculia bacterium]
MGHSFTSLLAGRGCLVLDGGLATHLATLGFDLAGELWSARALIDAPELVRGAHLAFLAAGADCVATASYQATLPGLHRAGLREIEARRILRRSVELAQEARDEHARATPGRGWHGGERRALVAASVGPFGAYLADGSEYRGGYALGREELVDFHRPRWRELSAAGPDLLAVETIPSADEALAILDLLEESSSAVPSGTPAPGAWLSLQCRDGRTLADGTPLADLVPFLVHPRLLALGVNCVAPALVTELLRTLREHSALPFVVYPNSGERWVDGRWRGSAAEWVTEAPSWRDLGAVAIGGCCRTGPDDIRRLRQVLEEAPATG